MSTPRMAHRKRWFVVADGGRARVLALSPDGHNLAIVHDMTSPDLHRKTHDLVTDRPGRSHESASPTRHAIAARTDPHELAKEDFVGAVGAWLNRQGQAGAFEDLVLVVTPAQAHALKAALDHPTQARVKETLTKDLTKTPDHDIHDRMIEAGLLAPRPTPPRGP